MSVYKVCEKCCDYPCHCGHEYKNKSDGYILETIRNLQLIYNDRAEANKELNITVGTETLQTYLNKQKDSNNVFVTKLSTNLKSLMPIDWTRHIRNHGNTAIRDMIDEIIEHHWTMDDFAYTAPFMIFALQCANQLDDRKLLGFILDYLINKVKVSTHATILVLKELKSSLSSGIAEFANHAWVVYKTLNDVPTSDPKDKLIMELFYKHTQRWIAEPTASPDRYCRLVLLIACIVTLDSSYLPKIKEWDKTEECWFYPINHSPIIRDELYFVNNELMNSIVNSFEAELKYVENNIQIFED